MEEDITQEPAFQAEDLQERQALLLDVTNSQAYKAGIRSCKRSPSQGEYFWLCN